MHVCPDCFESCTCSGDLEDHYTGDEFYEVCVCCLDGENWHDELDIDGDGL